MNLYQSSSETFSSKACTSDLPSKIYGPLTRLTTTALLPLRTQEINASTDAPLECVLVARHGGKNTPSFRLLAFGRIAEAASGLIGMDLIDHPRRRLNRVIVTVAHMCAA